MAPIAHGVTRGLGETKLGLYLSITGSKADTLGWINPIRYHGYVYDNETGLYYLQSRYYNPKTGRFINADAFTSTGQGFVGNNMFAYCNNNPVNMLDQSGCWPTTIKLESDDLEDFFEVVEAFFLEVYWEVSVSFISAHDLNRRPLRGEPGSVYEAPNGDKRKYGPDGLPEWDYDHSDHGEKDKPRDENGGHYHDWDFTKKKPRGDAYAMSGIGLVSGILLVLECLFMFSVY